MGAKLTDYVKQIFFIKIKRNKQLATFTKVFHILEAQLVDRVINRKMEKK